MDVYGYCLDDPINFHDQTGLAGKSEKPNEKAVKNIKLAGADNTEHPSEKLKKNKKTEHPYGSSVFCVIFLRLR